MSRFFAMSLSGITNLVGPGSTSRRYARRPARLVLLPVCVAAITQMMRVFLSPNHSSTGRQNGVRSSDQGPLRRPVAAGKMKCSCIQSTTGGLWRWPRASRCSTCIGMGRKYVSTSARSVSVWGCSVSATMNQRGPASFLDPTAPAIARAWKKRSELSALA